MKQGWEIKKLGEVCDIVNTTPKDFGGVKNYFSTGAINNDVVSTPEQVTFVNRPSRANSYPKRNDVGFAKMKLTNKVLLINDIYEGSIFSTGFCFLRPKNVLLSKYLYHFVISHLFQNIKDLHAGDGIMGGIKNSDVLEIYIPIPPLAEQQHIVAILDDAFAAIAKAKANAEQNLKNTKELFGSYLQSIFENKGDDWEEKSLGEICTKISDGVHQKPNYVSSGIPFIKINNLTDGDGISFENVSYITEEDHQLYRKRTNPEKGDILITKDGTIGVVRVIETDVEFSIFVSVALIKPKSKEITPFLKYVLISPLIQNQIKPKGAALKHLYLTDLRKFTIPIPTLSEQKTIVQNLDALSAKTKKLETIYQQKLAIMGELKKSILNQAFSGQLH